MISWNGLNGCKFSLTVDGYEYPDVVRGHDANWLLLNISLENALDAQSRTVADALAWELPKFAKWLQGIIDGRRDEPTFFFYDQHLRIEYDVESREQLRMSIDFKIWNDGIADTLSAQVSPSSGDLQSARDYILDRAKNFPPRGELGRKMSELSEKFDRIKIGKSPTTGHIRKYHISLDFEGPESEYSVKKNFEIWLEGDGFFDFDFPWRVIIERVRQIQESTWESAIIEIQPYEYFEDFVDFKLRLDNLVVDGYFEYSLCILYLRSESQELLELIQSNCSGHDVEEVKIV